jgi:hypothetical protein
MLSRQLLQAHHLVVVFWLIVVVLFLPSSNLVESLLSEHIRTSDEQVTLRQPTQAVNDLPWWKTGDNNTMPCFPVVSNDHGACIYLDFEYNLTVIVFHSTRLAGTTRSVTSNQHGIGMKNDRE